MNTRRNRSKRMTFAGICQCCGVQFQAFSAYAKWCSSNCRTQAYRCRRARRPITPGPGQRRLALQQLTTAQVPLLQPTGELEMREWNGTEIQRRQADGFVNATAMCKAGGREWFTYARSARTQEYIQALKAAPQICGTELVQSISGGTPNLQGTWIHPSLAIDLARWISPAFAVWMDGWFLESLTKPQQAQPAPTLAPGVHVVADTMNDARRLWAGALRSELIATLNLCDLDLFGTTDLPVPRFHYHLGA